MTAVALSAGTAARDTRPIAVWLLICAGMVFAMTIIGAITRLTESGLSMVEWRPLIGTLPPLSDAEWQRVFDLYRQTPEYRINNAGMTLAQFQEIFFWEWFHRLWGRLIGVVFAVPFLWFWATGRIPRPLLPKLAGLLVLGALQGVLGWYMVMSGLVDRPSVSQYRLAAHLSLAVLIYALLVWLALDLMRGARRDARRFALPAGAEAAHRHAWAAIAVVAVTIFWGALVAGIDAGLAYNTFPLMDGRVLPPEALSLTPAWLNLFENTAMVQFVHRWLGIVTGLAVLALWWRGRQVAASGIDREAGLIGDLAAAAGIMVLVQIGLGIATLLLYVPIPLAAAHQAGALVLLTLLLAFAHATTAQAAASAAARPA